MSDVSYFVPEAVIVRDDVGDLQLSPRGAPVAGCVRKVLYAHI